VAVLAAYPSVQGAGLIADLAWACDMQDLTPIRPPIRDPDSGIDGATWRARPGVAKSVRRLRFPASP
jgi:hypothetical protein